MAALSAGALLVHGDEYGFDARTGPTVELAEHSVWLPPPSKGHHYVVLIPNHALSISNMMGRLARVISVTVAL